MLSLQITAYTRRDEHAIYDLLDQTHFAHVHMDWLTLDDWLRDAIQPTVLAWDGARLIGVLSAGLALGGASWLRIIAVHPDEDPVQVLPPLWERLAARLRAQNTTEAGALVFRGPLFTDALHSIGMNHRDQIVTLGRRGRELPRLPEQTTAEIRITASGWEDVPHAVQIDHAAFAPIWRMSALSLRQAVRRDSYFTLAHVGSEMVGYQITTRHHDSVHLARLAVLPETQGMGIGGLLLTDALQQTFRRGIDHMTLNTQSLNAQSLRLYTRFGFERTFVDTPFFWRTM